MVSFSLQLLYLLLATAQHQRAKGAGTGARGRMSRLTRSPAAKPARLCGKLRPSSENKGEGLTLARRPPAPGRTPSLLGPFKAALQDHGQPLALRRPFKAIAHGAVPQGSRDVTWQKEPPPPPPPQKKPEKGTQMQASPVLDSGPQIPNTR